MENVSRQQYSHISVDSFPKPPHIEREQLLGAAAVVTMNATTVVTSYMTSFMESEKNLPGANLPGEMPFKRKLPNSWSMPHISTAENELRQQQQMRQRQQLLFKPREASNDFCSKISTPTTGVDEVKEDGPTRILDFMYLGSLEDALNRRYLEKYKIKKIITISEKCPRPEGFPDDEDHFLRIPVSDSTQARLLPYFDECFNFIESARRTGENVLLHCLAGISRSPTLAIAYIMRSQGLDYEEARKFVKSRRPSISPNINFMGQLMVYEQLLRANRLLPSSISKSQSEHNCSFSFHDSDNIYASLSAVLKVDSELKGNGEEAEQTMSRKVQSRMSCGSCGTSSSNSSTSDSFEMNNNNSISSTTSTFSEPINYPTLTSASPVTTTTLNARDAFVNKNGKRIIETPLALPQRPRQLFCNYSADNRSSLRKSEKQDEMLSPSSEFSKLDISLMNPCFALNNKRPSSIACSSSRSGIRSETNESSTAVETPLMLANPTFEMRRNEINTNSDHSEVQIRRMTTSDRWQAMNIIPTTSSAIITGFPSGSEDTTANNECAEKKSFLRAMLRKNRHSHNEENAPSHPIYATTSLSDNSASSLWNRCKKMSNPCSSSNAYANNLLCKFKHNNNKVRANRSSILESEAKLRSTSITLKTQSRRGNIVDNNEYITTNTPKPYPNLAAIYEHSEVDSDEKCAIKCGQIIPPNKAANLEADKINNDSFSQITRGNTSIAPPMMLNSNEGNQVDAAFRDPERSSISSASSLEITVN